MASHETGWPLLEERRPFARARRQPSAGRTRRPRSAWLLTALAFICGGLVSAAGFSIGWRHQAQQSDSAQTALAGATRRIHTLQGKTHDLEHSLAAERLAQRRDRRAREAAESSSRALARAAATLSSQATTSDRAAASLAGDAGDLSSTASRVANELKTLTTYLTTTPARQLDPGYVASQAAYLAQQLETLQSRGGSLGGAATSLEADAHRLAQLAAALSQRG